MYFSIDYKFVFVYEASLSSREVGGSSNPLRGPSMSGSRLCEGVIFIPPKANQRMVVLVLSRVILVLNSMRVGKMLANHIEVAINLNIFFIQFVQICLYVFLLIYTILYIDAEAENAPNVGKKKV